MFPSDQVRVISSPKVALVGEEGIILRELALNDQGYRMYLVEFDNRIAPVALSEQQLVLVKSNSY